MIRSSVEVRIYINSGSGFFKVTLPQLGTTNPSDIHIDLGNVDQDDDMDLVVSYDKNVYLYRNDGAWTKTTIASGLSDIKGVT